MGLRANCCSCCSFRCVAAFSFLIALFPTVINPFLDSLVRDVATEVADSLAGEVSKKPYVDGQTDVLGYSRLVFLKGTESMQNIDIGMVYLAIQPFPRWVAYILSKLGPNTDHLKEKMEAMPVDLMDARKTDEDLSFAESGFTLHTMDQPSATTWWRSQSDTDKFRKEMEPVIRELYPSVKRMEWTYSVVRGGTYPMDQPAAIDGPHLDYSQNDTARAEFHSVYPTNTWAREHALLLGEEDTEDEKLGVILGLWKPVYMSTPVCDFPLMVMDARSFKPEHERPFHLHIRAGIEYHNLNGAIVHDPSQKWYYYPFQTTDEVLIFTQYSRGKFFANPHGSFMNPNCPEGMATRQSIEMRVGLFF